MTDTIINNYFIEDVFKFTELIVIFSVIFALVIWGYRDHKHFKKLLAICILIPVVMLTVFYAHISKVYLDMKYEDYITYCGEYVDCGARGNDTFGSVVMIYDEQGREIRLEKTGRSDKGTYTGTVIYGKRSKVIVEYSGTPMG